MPKVSVIIPIYNAEKYLKKCLDSVINQTLKDIEIICINDCATDNSPAILKEYAKEDGRIKIINLPKNNGVGYARNIGLDVAIGEYIMFLDSDDFYELNTCKVAYENMQNGGSDIGIFAYIRQDIYGQKPSWRYNLIKEMYHKTKNHRFYNFLTFVWDKIYKHQFLKEHQIRFNKCVKTSEDVIFNYLCYFYNPNYKFIPELLITHRKDIETSITSNDNITHNDIEAFFAIYNSKEFSTQSLDTQLLVLEGFLRSFNWHLKKYKNTKSYKKISTEVKYFYKFIENNYSKKELSKLECYKKYKNDRVKNLLQTIFSIKNVNTHKLITIIGIKISTKRNRHGNHSHCNSN